MDQRERFEAYFNSRWPEFQHPKDSAFELWQAAEAAALECAAHICEDNAESVKHLERSVAATALTVTAMHIRKLARLHPIASEQTEDLARPLPDKP